MGWVGDNGIGIDTMYHERVFEPFERLDKNVDGSGLGLTRVKQIIEHHDGKVWVESEGRNKGSKFYFNLPLTCTETEKS